MSKRELVHLYNTTVAEKDDLAKKCGQYPHVSHGEVCRMLTMYG